MRKKFTASTKLAIALEALHEIKTINQLSTEYEVHATQISLWKKHAQEGLLALFTDKRGKREADQSALIEKLYIIIGQREVELAWLKKKITHLSS
jgi:transposase-like protein